VEIGHHLAFSACDGIFVEASDLGHEADASMSETLGFDRGVPPALLLVQAAEKQIDLLMQKPLSQIGFLQTGSTFTLVEGSGRHKFSREKRYAYSTLKTEPVSGRGLRSNTFKISRNRVEPTDQPADASWVRQGVITPRYAASPDRPPDEET
jgi:hypothetical protein